MNMQIDLEKGIANVGDVSRMKEVMARAKRGGRLVIGFIGGSITQGSLSSTPQTCYAYRVYTWWKETFPQAEFVYCNAGIGGTTSEFGAARVGTDLLAERPAFVIVEFSVNDESTEHFKETYEGLVRKILGAAWNPAVLLVHNVFYHNGANAQVMHAAIGRHYDLPSVSMQNSIYPEVVAGRIENRAITPDDLHPNDEGHARVASVITYFLEQVRSGKLTGSNASFAPGAKLPVPLTKNAYEDSVRIRNAAAPDMAGLQQPTLDGFTPDETAQNEITDCFRYGWTAKKTGDAITFLVEGSCIAVQYRKSVKLPAPVALAIVDDDTEHAVRLDANFDEDWGDSLTLTPVMVHGANGTHTVEVRLISGDETMPAAFELISVITSEK